MTDVDRFRKRRSKRLSQRGIRKDDGNTRLPFGLCQREGIEIGKDWEPSDAWAALAKKGITPKSEYAKRAGNEESKRGTNPNDDVKRTHNERSLKGFDNYRKERAKKSFINDLTPDEKEDTADMLTEIFDKGAYRVVRGEGSFGGIILNGYKSQMETGKSGEGSKLDKGRRSKTSDMLFGHGGVEDGEYEKYGYLGFADDEKDQEDIGKPGYGGVTYTLKKDRMKDRTTYTFGDSANTKESVSSAGYGGEKPTIEGMSSLGNAEQVRNVLKAYRGYKNGEYDYDEMFERIKDGADNMYVELQFHGPITVEDIDTVTFSDQRSLIKAFSEMSNSNRQKVIKRIKENGVKVKFMSDGEYKNGMEWIEAVF